MGKSVGFFHGCKSELAKAHLTLDRDDINKLLIGVTPNLYRYAYAITGREAGWNEPDDYVQIGLLAIVKCLPKYRYICSYCSVEYDNAVDYTKHSRSIHRGVFPPKETLERYLGLSVRGLIVNYKRVDLAKKRTVPSDSFVLSDIAEFLHGRGECPHEMLASKLAIEKLRQRLDLEVDRRIKLYISRLIEGDTRRQAYQAIYESGMYSSINSARVTMEKLRRETNKFDKYRQALVG